MVVCMADDVAQTRYPLGGFEAKRDVGPFVGGCGDITVVFLAPTALFERLIKQADKTYTVRRICRVVPSGFYRIVILQLPPVRN